jgi:Zn-dependent protease with chaperone function
MSQTIAEYEALVERLEHSSGQNPGWYRTKVLMLAALGFAYVLVVLLLSVGGVVALGAFVIAMPNGLTIKLGLVAGIPLFLTVWGSVKALRVPFEPPQGRTLTRDDYPRLFERIEEIRRELDGPKVHEVVLQPEMNAAIMGIPRLGLLGWHKNYLILGLELMSTLTPEEFDAVVAHEMGHLSGDHGRISGWIYRIRRTWDQLAINVQTQGGVSFFFRRFFHWFIPYFGAYSFVLARQHEYEADRAAAQVTSPEAAGQALVRVSTASLYLGEHYWPAMKDRVKQSMTPPTDIYTDMRAAVTQGLAGELAEDLLDTELSRRPGLNDTHPSLAMRLEALDVDARPPRPPASVAGEVYLGEDFEVLLASYGELWADDMAGGWSELHTELNEGAERLAELEEKRADGELDLDEFGEYALLVEHLRDEEEGVALLEEAVALAPEHASARFHLGRILIAKGQENGIAHLDQAMQLDEFLVPEACNLVVGYIFEHGERAAAQKWVDRHDNFTQKMALAQHERSVIQPDDTFIPPTLDREVERAIHETFAAYDGRCRIYFVEKMLQVFPENALYIIGVERRAGPLVRPADKLIDELVATIELPIHVVYVCMHGLEKAAKKIRKVPGSRIV